MKLLTSIVTTGLVAFSVAGPLSFAGKTQPVRAGVIIVDSQRFNSVPFSPSPHLFGQLDADRAIRPASWAFVNPRAQTVLTDTTRSRWLNLDATTPATGTALGKRTAPYWEVNLSTTTSDALEDYDVLYLGASGSISLSSIERERLRQFVDKGGLLWVDVFPSAVLDPINNLPVPFEVITAGGALFADANHPVLNRPNKVTVGELITVLPTTGGPQSIGVMEQSDIGGLTNLFSSIPGESLRLQPIVGEGPDSMAISMSRVGDGFLMISTRSLGSYLNRGNLNGSFNANRGFLSLPPIFDTQFGVVSKLLINAINLTSQSTGDGGGTRQNSAIPVEIPAPLFRSFDVGDVPNGNNMTVYKGFLVYTTGSNVVCVDLDPALDRDGDGNPDDGLRDPLGSPVDVLWISEDLTAPSAPVCSELVRGVVGDQVRDKVFVTESGSGAVYQFDMYPANPQVQVPSDTSYNPPQAPDGGGTPLTPVIHDGILYQTDVFSGLGRVWAVDLHRRAGITSAQRWQVVSAPQLGVPSASPTISHVPIQDNSGGLDRVMYVPFRPDVARQAGMVSIWLGTRGEAPQAIGQSGSTLTVTTRAALNNVPIYLPGSSPSLGLKLTVLDANGNAYSESQISSWFTNTVTPGGQNGVLNFQLTAAGQAIDWQTTTDHSIRLDYSLDWGAVGFGNQNSALFIRGDVQFPQDPVNQLSVQGPIAAGSNGAIFAVLAPSDPAQSGGSLYAMREIGRGEFRVLYRWECHDAFSFSTLNSTAPIQYDPCVIDYDGIVDLPRIGGFLDQRMQNLRIIGGAAVQNDKVYIAVAGRKGFPNANRYVTTVVALDADPDPLEVEIDGLTNSNFAIVQPDPTRSPNKSSLATFTAIQPNQFSSESAGSTVRVRLQSSSPSTRGRLSNVIAVNLPLILRTGGRNDILVEPELVSGNIITKPGVTSPYVPGNGRGRWNPQVWQMTLNGQNATTRPFVAGDMLYLAGGSFLPQIFSGNFRFNDQDGLIYAIDTRVGSNDIRTPSLVRRHMSNDSVARTWQPYLVTLSGNSVDNITPSPYVLMPDFRGSRSFSDLRIRVRQVTLESDRVDGMTGGEGRLVLWGSGGISQSYVYAQGDWVVADEGRILRVNSIGQPIWTTDATTSAGEEGTISFSSIINGISKPSRAYPTGQNTFIIADPGSNRVLEMDNAARELRTISKFSVDPTYLPADVADNVVRTLSQPSDVVRYNSFVRAANNPFTNAQPDEYWVHHLIADAGNGRIIELVDRYVYNRANQTIGAVVEYLDPSSTRPGNRERALGMLNWQISSEIVERRYAFNSITRAFYTDAASATRPIFAFGFGNREPSRASFGLDSPVATPDIPSGSGGVVLYDPARGATKIITEFSVPNINGGIFWNEATDLFDSAPRPATVQKIAGLKSVTMRFVRVGAGFTLAVMITDSTGVYELIDPDEDGNWSLRWMLPRDAYKVLYRATISGQITPTAQNAADFRPNYAERLDSGEVLVVNGYVGRQRFDLPVVNSFGISAGDPFSGEVVLFNGRFSSDPDVNGFDWNKTNLGFDSFSVSFQLPPIQGVRGLVAPVFAGKK